MDIAPSLASGMFEVNKIFCLSDYPVPDQASDENPLLLMCPEGESIATILVCHNFYHSFYWSWNQTLRFGLVPRLSFYHTKQETFIAVSNYEMLAAPWK